MRLSPRDRWRLILGRERSQLPQEYRGLARSLDGLYGSGGGEGSRNLLPASGGDGDTSVDARTWLGEIAALFPQDVFEEVRGDAAAAGAASAILDLKEEEIVPSVELLTQILALKGAIPESKLGVLRRICRTITDAILNEIAIRMEPALRGALLPQPTPRPTGHLDIPRTIRSNLQGLRTDDQGQPTLIPEKLIFRSRGAKTLDWRVILVVDVSGSMERSVVYSAMVAAILSGLPWVETHFLAFNTRVIDMSEKVDDPLGLLLEIAIGGGTHIAKALRYAQTLVTVPKRTAMIVVSDFDEGFGLSPLLHQVRSIVEDGTKLIGLAALSDGGSARYNAAIASALVALGMPIAAMSPLELAHWLGKQFRSE